MTLNCQKFLEFIPSEPTFVLFGSDLSYSISDKIHQLIFDTYNLNCKYIYVEIKKDELVCAIKHLKRHFCGANITIPYKTDVIDLLDHVDDIASGLKSVNTIKVENGETFGYNTDYLGILHSFEKDDVIFENKNVSLIGSGATANVIAYLLAEKNANITLFARNTEKALDTMTLVLEKFPKTKISVKLLAEFTDDFDIVCNATPVGMNNLIGVSPVCEIKKAEYCFDVIYNPFMTKFLKDAKKNNVKVRNGLLMLLVQAFYAEQIWNDLSIDRIDDLYQEIIDFLILKRLENKKMIIVGFMASGKSTFASYLHEKINFKLIDTDKIIEKRENKAISDIFNTSGEKHFRLIEHELALELHDMVDVIISTGGGFPIDNPNFTKMRENSIVIFLDTPFDVILKRLENDISRPLANFDNLASIYRKRYEKYCSIYDIKINIFDDNDQIYKQIQEYL